MRENVVINMNRGLEARPAAMLVQVANRYESNVYMETENKKINLKSIMGVMSLVLDDGEEVVILAEGGDEESAIKGVGDFLTGVGN